MKNECDIVKDLLFSYKDGVLSDTSKELVENHLKTCESCKNMLKEIIQEDEEKKHNREKSEKKQIDAFKGVRKKITKKNVIISISLIVLAIIIIFNIFVFKNYNEITSEMSITLQEDVTEAQIENIKKAIQENTSEAQITYLSKEEQLNEVKAWLGDEADILNPYSGEDNPFKPSLIIKVKKNVDIQKIVEAIQDMPGIYNTNTYINQNPYELFLFQVFNG